MEKYIEIETDYGQKYIQWDDKGVIRLIPCDEANSDYQRYLRWLENPNAEENQGGLI